MITYPKQKRQPNIHVTGQPAMKQHLGPARPRPKKPLTYKDKTQKGGITGGGFQQGTLPGGGTPGRPGVPGLPGTPPVANPDDSIYENQMNALQTRLNNENLGYGQQEESINSTFGFGPQYAQDPYTRAAILQRHASQREAGTLNGMAGAGQLYSGATNNARAADVLTSGQELNDTRREMMDMLQQVQQQRLASQSSFAEGGADAYQSLIDRMTGAEPDPSLFSAGDEAGVPGAGGGKDKNGKSGKDDKGKKPLKKKPKLNLRRTPMPLKKNTIKPKASGNIGIVKPAQKKRK